MHIQRKKVNGLVEKLEESFTELLNELSNQRIAKTKYLAADIMDLDKDMILAESAKLIALINQAKKLKPFNPNSSEDL